MQLNQIIIIVVLDQLLIQSSWDRSLAIVTILLVRPVYLRIKVVFNTTHIKFLVLSSGIVKKSFKSISLPSDSNLNSSTFILFCFCLVFIFFYICYLLVACVYLFDLLMRRAKSLDFLNLDPEIERTLRRLRRERRERNPEMAKQNNPNQSRNEQEQRALRDYFKPIVNDNYSGIHHQPINTNNFELKSALINMVQQNQLGGVAV